MSQILVAIYVLSILILSVYGLLGFFTLWLYWRNRHRKFPTPQVAEEDLPFVTVQLPIYNERYVVHRLLGAVIKLDYPKDRLEIQVIDDSEDITAEISAALVESLQKRGHNVQYLHRSERTGYKAGALSQALDLANGEFLAIFDADFLPDPTFLRDTIPHFINAPDLGVVQARWGHLNAGDSPLTAAQSIALDKHFMMDQTVRHRAHMYPKFNGTAGLWRRACLEDAGGWQDDTVCEDLCLSTRAAVKGWQFLFLQDVVAPAELPSSILAYKNQQARWAKGSVQCFQKYARDIIHDSHYSLAGKLYALLTMSSYLTHLVLMVMLLLQIPMLLLDVSPPSYLIFFSIIGIGQPVLFILAQKEIYHDWLRRLLFFPALLVVAIGIAPSNSRAILQILLRRDHPFIRTPKGVAAKSSQKASKPYQIPFDPILFLEIFLAAYAALGLILAIYKENFGIIFFLLLNLAGLGYIVWLSVAELFFDSKNPPQVQNYFLEKPVSGSSLE